MQAFNRFLTIAMAAFFGVWVGNTGILIWRYINTPELFDMQSAPWYTQIWVEGLFTAVVLAVGFLIKWIIKKMSK